MMEKVKILFGTLIGSFFSFFGILAVPLALLIPCNIIDYFTGMAASKMRGEKITSKRGFQGICKKVVMYILIFIGFGIDCMISYTAGTLNIEAELPRICAAIIASWLVINELISITENCETFGIKVPILMPVLKMIKKKIEVKSSTHFEEGKDGE